MNTAEWHDEFPFTDPSGISPLNNNNNKYRKIQHVKGIQGAVILLM